MAKTPSNRWFLKAWRKHRGYNQERMAEMSELSLGYYNEVETGKRRYNQDLLERFADVLQCDPADLITRDPADPEAIWDLYDKMTSTQRAQVVEIAKTLLKVS